MPLQIVCLSTLGISSRFIVERILQAFPATRLVRLRFQSPRISWRRRWRRWTPSRCWRRIEDRVFYRRHQAAGAARVQQLLYGDQPLPELPVWGEFATTVLNQVATAAAIRSLRPDVMITVGAPLLRPHLFGIPRLGTLNVHFGIAPYYRGEETLFWPLYYRDEGRLGVTIHQIDAGIDTGPTLVQGYVEVTSEDTEWSLEAKTARLGGELLVELLQTGQFRPVWQYPRQTAGRQFNYHSRHLWHDARLFLRRRLERLPLSPASQRVDNFCLAPPPPRELDASPLATR